MLGTLNAAISSTYTALIQMEGTEIAAIVVFLCFMLNLAVPLKIAHLNELLHVTTVLLERG